MQTVLIWPYYLIGAEISGYSDLCEHFLGLWYLMGILVLCAPNKKTPQHFTHLQVHLLNCIKKRMHQSLEHVLSFLLCLPPHPPNLLHPPEEQHSTPLPPTPGLFPPTSQSSTNTLTTTAHPKLQDAGAITLVGGGVRRQHGSSVRLWGVGGFRMTFFG